MINDLMRRPRIDHVVFPGVGSPAQGDGSVTAWRERGLAFPANRRRTAHGGFILGTTQNSPVVEKCTVGNSVSYCPTSHIGTPMKHLFAKPSPSGAASTPSPSASGAAAGANPASSKAPAVIQRHDNWRETV